MVCEELEIVIGMQEGWLCLEKLQDAILINGHQSKEGLCRVKGDLRYAHFILKLQIET